ncbi:unnamed protein product [Dovyalis caffra]|uniref:Uncharacterized protein n=1 Tax=Dovyalis caffra TaxID=77055 RepID=A0AAV1SP27_9ROSI|nr:unnamed protein product [Dovyalis caffra]
MENRLDKLESDVKKIPGIEGRLERIGSNMNLMMQQMKETQHSLRTFAETSGDEPESPCGIRASLDLEPLWRRTTRMRRGSGPASIQREEHGLYYVGCIEIPSAITSCGVTRGLPTKPILHEYNGESKGYAISVMRSGMRATGVSKGSCMSYSVSESDEASQAEGNFEPMGDGDSLGEWSYLLISSWVRPNHVLSSLRERSTGETKDD